MGIALITGASSGIGKAIALELARRKEQPKWLRVDDRRDPADRREAGWQVGLVARREKELAEVADGVRAAGAEAAIQVADVGDRAGIEAATAAIEKQFGRIDLLVASAGIGMPHTPKEKVFDTDAVERTLRVNVLGVVYAIGAALPGMLARGAGQISAVSSLAAYRGLPRSHAYGASKACVNLLLEGLRLDLRQRGVGVSIINPGFVDTPLVEKNRDRMPFLVPPARAARVIVDGLLRRKRVIEFPFPLVAAVKLGRAIPDAIYDWLVAGRGLK